MLCVLPHDLTVLASAKRWMGEHVDGRRGDIYDRNGERVATSLSSADIVLDPMRLLPEQEERVIGRLAEAMKLPKESLLAKLRKIRETQPGSRHLVLGKRVHPSVEQAVRRLGHNAVFVKSSYHRYYPEGALMEHVVGFVNDNGAGNGLEREFNASLVGGNYRMPRRMDRWGRVVDDPSHLYDTTQVQGMSVFMTLDRHVQWYAERALDEMVDGSAPESACAIVVDVATGDVLAMANVPGFDPNRLEADPAPRRNHCIQDQLEPGSVLKPFTVAASLEEERSTPDKVYDAGPSFRVGSSTIRDDHPNDQVTVREIIKYSSNIGTAKLILELGDEIGLRYLRSFGFGARTGIMLPSEQSGVLRGVGLKQIELATTSYGQGMSATPLQLAMGTAAIANGGVLMAPRIVERVEDAFGIVEELYEPRAVRRVVSEKVAKQVQEMMVEVTQEGGTGTKARVDGIEVGGKTGTAQKPFQGGYGTDRVSSFVGFAPAENPSIAVVVVVDSPQKGSRYGGTVAGPVFSSIVEHTLAHLGEPALVKPPSERLAAASDLPESDVALVWKDAGWRIPDLSGQPKRDVVQLLQGTGLEVHVKGSGNVATQTPLPGSVVAPGQSLHLLFR
jgi:cell division protein FtsI (penicillin-binding protein 3)